MNQHDRSHYYFTRQLPHGSMPTRKFSVRPEAPDPESAPWVKAALWIVGIGFIATFFMG